MTVEIEYDVPFLINGLGQWQVDMAKQIETNHGFLARDIERQLRGSVFIVRVDADLQNKAVGNMLSDIEDHLPDTATHIETREVE